MKRIKLTIFALALLGTVVPSGAQEAQTAPRKFDFKWSRVIMDQHRTGTEIVNAENMATALGSVNGKVYKAPNGKVYKGGATAAVAALLIEAQPAMARVKEVIGTSTKAMVRTAPENELADMFADVMDAALEKEIGEHIDMGFYNSGGIRIDMPEGAVVIDDIQSMFPFKNYLTLVRLKGKDIRPTLERMAAHPELMGCSGIRLVFKDGKVVSATVDGQPLNDKKVYNVATVNFLLNGGDGFFLAKNAQEVKLTEAMPMDIILDYIKGLTAEGKAIEYEKDGRIIIEQ